VHHNLVTRDELDSVLCYDFEVEEV
jgi:hypothetical protein